MMHPIAGGANARRASCTYNGADASRAGNHDHTSALVFLYSIIHAGSAQGRRLYLDDGNDREVPCGQEAGTNR